jgi:predicted RNA-binding Zn-ribbon protein involved in translation (DUF1610 family)
MLKILLVDIETAPKRAFVWGMWKQNIAPKQMISDWFMLTWAAKWYGSDEIFAEKLSSDEVMHEDDKRILYPLWYLMDKADVVIGHNGDRFDVPSINTRFLMHDMSPPSPYRTVDTLKIAKRHFRFTSNRLDYLGDVLGVGRKIDTGGFELWEKCLKGDEKAMDDMLTYNKQDVFLLEDVYDKLKPFAKIHPSHAATEEEQVCPKCGGDHMIKRGFAYTNTARYQRYRCMECGSWSRSRANDRSKEEMKNTLSPL